MRGTFQRWLFFFVAVSFAALFLLTFYVQTREAYSDAEDHIQLRLEDVQKQIRISEKAALAILNVYNSSVASDVRTVAYFLQRCPEYATNSFLLEDLRKSVGYDEIHVINEHGVIENTAVNPTLGNPEKFIGFNLRLHAQSEPFLEGLKQPDFVLVQPPLPRGLDRKLFLYSGASRKDAPGLVQIGASVDFLESSLENSRLAQLSPSLRVGTSGEILICRGEKVIGAARTDFEGRTLASVGFRPELISSFVQGEGEFDETIDGVPVFGLYMQSNNLTLIGIKPEYEITQKRNGMVILLVATCLILTLVVFVSVSKLVQKIVIDGIDRINVSLGKITAGDLEEKVEERGSREFEELSGGINSMVDALKGAIAAEKTRLDSELDFARAVQASALPQLHQDPRFEIYASMEPAKEVGGDFYDFFHLDASRLAFLIADVSGKGIPAAMFMMKAKAQLKSSLLANQGRTLDQIIAEVNDSVCEGNDACMFVTVFAGVLDICTGEVVYVNAGHNAPVMRKNDGSSSWLPVDNGFVIGGMDGVSYERQTVRLEKGDGLLLYTDGVTEAMNKKHALYGDDRLIALMDGPIMRSAPADCILDELKDDVKTYADGAPQSDDITMLFLRYLG
ncbi:SpoIIE family protein phosphatase [bacterium]|nr:SpoIIE family protein phosphatase [bacterium]